MTFITEHTIACLYSAYIEFPIFNEFNFPPAKKVDFVIVNSQSMYGEYTPDPHTITISIGKCSHLATVNATLMHEMVHMAVFLKHPKTETYVKHKGLWKKLQQRVASLYGFDPKEL